MVFLYVHYDKFHLSHTYMGKVRDERAQHIYIFIQIVNILYLSFIRIVCRVSVYVHTRFE